MLSKHLITCGAYLEHFADLPADLAWSLERIERSMHETMAMRMGRGDIWVFAYGSLIWNPLLSFSDQQGATLRGWHRSFCMQILAGRATSECPGRMLALEPGGSTQGLAYCLTEEVAKEELILLWVREMPTGAYRPIWTHIELEDGNQMEALVFVAQTEHPLYQVDASVEAIAHCIARAEGPMGSNADYVHKLCCALSERGIADEYIGALSAEILF